MAYEDYCAACTYINESADYNGKYWCEKKGEDHYACDPKCYSFCEAYGRSNYARGNMYDNSKNHTSSGCYLTTIMCQILNYPDNNYYLNTLRKFRDNIMKNNPKYIPLLITYDTIGPLISYELSRDKNNKVIAMSLFNNYLTKSVLAIEEQKYETAINTYIALTDTLAKRYHISTNIKMPDINNVDMNLLGHAKTRKINYNK